MKTDNTRGKTELYLQLVVLILLGCMDLFSSHIRMSYGDAPFGFYQMIVHKGFWVSHGRYAGYLTQWMPVLAIYFKLGYKWVFYVYTMNVFVSSTIITVLYYKITRDRIGLWVLILSYVMGMSSSYYYYCLDHSFGYVFSTFSILMMSYLVRRNEIMASLFWTLACFVCILSNPYHCIMLIIGLGYIAIDVPKKYKYILSQVFILLLAVILIKFVIPSSPYEQEKLSVLKENLMHINELDKAAFRYYYDSIFGQSLLLKAFYVIVLILGILRRKFYMLLLGITVYFLAYYLNCLYNFNWESNAYMDLYGRLIQLSVLVCLYFIIRDLEIQWVFTTALFLFILVMNVQLIVQKYPVYNGRYEYIETKLKRMRMEGISKLAIHEKLLDYNILLLDWALAYESLVLSTYDDEPRTMFTRDFKAIGSKNLKTDVLYSRFYEEPYGDIANTYFEKLPKLPYRFELDSL